MLIKGEKDINFFLYEIKVRNKYEFYIFDFYENCFLMVY